MDHSRETRPERQPGAVVGGRYRIEGLVGKGGTSSVYRATHVRTGRAVAVKVMDHALSLDPVAVRRFEREARVTSKVPHPNLIEVLDAGLDADRRPYLVTELLEGETLASLLLRTPGPLPLREVASLTLPLLEALAAAHAAGIVHRDLKPGNIFLHVGHDGRRVPKLMDFGIAKSLVPANITMLTLPGAIFGTPHYISPEQALSSRDVDARADVWSVGVVLYRLLVGRVPFDGPHLGEVLSQIFDSIPTAPSAFGVPASVSSVVMRCLAKSRDARYPDAAAVRLALCDALGLPHDAGARPTLPSLRVAAAPSLPPTIRPPRPAPEAPVSPVAAAAPKVSLPPFTPPPPVTAPMDLAAFVPAPGRSATLSLYPQEGRAGMAAAIMVGVALWLIAGTLLLRMFA